MSTDLQKKTDGELAEQSEFHAWDDNLRATLARRLPAEIGDRQVTELIAYMRTVPKLARCTKESLALGVLRMAETGLRLGSEAYLIPSNNKGPDGKKRLEARWQTDYRGELKLIRRSGMIGKIVCQVVYESEVEHTAGRFAIVQHDSPPFVHVPALRKRDRGEPVGAYCCGIVDGQWTDVEWMDAEDFDEHRSRYVRAGGGPWSDPVQRLEMWRKTVLRRWAKTQPVADEYRSAVEAEHADWYAPQNGGVVDATSHAPQRASLSGRLLGAMAAESPKTADAPSSSPASAMDRLKALARARLSGGELDGVIEGIEMLGDDVAESSLETIEDLQDGDQVGALRKLKP